MIDLYHHAIYITSFKNVRYTKVGDIQKQGHQLLLQASINDYLPDLVLGKIISPSWRTTLLITLSMYQPPHLAALPGWSN